MKTYGDLFKELERMGPAGDIPELLSATKSYCNACKLDFEEIVAEAVIALKVRKEDLGDGTILFEGPKKIPAYKPLPVLHPRWTLRRKEEKRDGYLTYELYQEITVPDFESITDSLEVQDEVRLAIVEDHLISHHSSREFLTDFQRCELSKVYEPVKSEGELGHLTQSVSPQTLERAKFLMEHADDNIKGRLRRGESNIDAEYEALQYQPKQTDPRLFFFERPREERNSQNPF